MKFKTMELIRISDKKKSYMVDVQVCYKFLDLIFFRQRKSFRKGKDSENWFRFPAEVPASPNEVRKLNHWLYNHKKFVQPQTEQH